MPGGAALVVPINELLALPFARIDATQDWHPADHRSFLGREDNLYPPHCVAGTPGAEFLPGLHTNRFHAIWRKGFQRDFEAYAVTAQHPAFADFLKRSGVASVVVCGIAANICCFYSARDLADAGLEVWMAEEAMAGIDVPAAALFQARAKQEAIARGIRYATVAAIRTNLSTRGTN